MQKKTIVVKIGSSVLFTSRGKLDEFRVLHFIDQICQLQKQGIFIVLILSGAVVYGAIHLQRIIANHLRTCVSNRLYSPIDKQVLAGIGQALIISKLVNVCSQKGLIIAQILLTESDFKKKCKQLFNTLNEMNSREIIPIINENDVVELNSFGGNDLLAAKIAQMMCARLVILSTREGSTYGVGGKKTKIEAVRQLKKMGLYAVIKNGKEKNCLLQEGLV